MNKLSLETSSLSPLRKEAPTRSLSVETTLVIRPRRHLFALDIKAIWEYRELLYFLIWRDLKVRYRQSVIGVGWVILQPLMTMVVFTAVFGKFVGVPSDGLPYPIFIFSALLPWNLFASALTRGSASVVDNTQLVSKVYPPPHPTTLRCFVARGRFCRSVWHFDWNDGLVWHFTYLGDPRSSPTRTAGDLNRSRHRYLAFSIEREVPRRWPYGTVFGPNLDVHKSRNLSG